MTAITRRVRPVDVQGGLDKDPSGKQFAAHVTPALGYGVRALGLDRAHVHEFRCLSSGEAAQVADRLAAHGCASVVVWRRRLL